MSTPYEYGSAALDELIIWAEAHAVELGRNEATTRLHLIDRLLTDVLGWPQEEIEAEPNIEGDYIDYRLGQPFARMIVEAKREGRHFSLPAGSTGTVQSLKPLTSGTEGRELREAAAQVAKYCGANGVAIAVVCNGNQLVAFLGTRLDGKPPLSGSSLIFTSLRNMQANFRMLWDSLSKYGVENRGIHILLREGERPSAPKPLSAQISGYPRFKGRNDIQNELELLAEVFLEDITRTPELQEEFLTETYAVSGALSQYAAISKQIIGSRYAALKETESRVKLEPVADKKGSKLRGELKAITSDTLASGLSKRPMILLGDVGVGKTMFIQHLIHVDAKDFFDQAIAIYVDFGRQPALLTQLDDFVAVEVERQLLANYDIDIQASDFVEATYNGALNRFDKGMHGKLREIDALAYQRERINFLLRLVGDRNEHLKASLGHLRGSSRRQVVIFLDNIDQRDAEFQERVFLLSEALASDWPVTVFVSLRPDTFYRSRSEGALTAYQTRVFTIAPPQIEVVLKKRIQFALAKLRGGTYMEQFEAGVNIMSDSLADYFEVLLQNIDSNERLVTLITNLADGNTRRALDFVSAFIGSGHVDTANILRIYRESGRYTIPIHQFLRAIIFGDHEYYDPKAALSIANVFNISYPDGREHFLACLLVSRAEVAGSKLGRDGFIPIDEMFTFAQGIGFTPEQITWSVEQLVSRGLLERSPVASLRDHRVAVRVTSIGVYTVRVLVKVFTYLDAMVVDTPIVDSRYRALITDVQFLSDRLRRAEIFRVYLDGYWRKLEADIPDSPFNWREASIDLADSVAEITNRSQRSAD